MKPNGNFLSNNRTTTIILSAFIFGSIAVSTAAKGGSLGHHVQANSAASQKAQSALAKQLPAPQETIVDSGSVLPAKGSIWTAQAESVERANLPLSGNAGTTNQETMNQTSTPSSIVTTSATTTTASARLTDNTTIYTTNTLSFHNKAGDCYVAYEGKIYDVSSQPVWSTCNYSGVLGGTDVTASFPNADYYFNTLPQVGVYMDTTTQTNNNTNTNANTNNSNTNTDNTANNPSSNSNTNSTNSTGGASANSQSAVPQTKWHEEDEGGDEYKYGQPQNTGNTGVLNNTEGQRDRGEQENDD